MVSLSTQPPLTPFSLSLTLSLSLWFHSKSIGHKKAVALWLWLWLGCGTVTVTGSGSGFVCCMLITVCYVLSCPPSPCLPLRFYLLLHSNKHASPTHTHTHMCTFIIAHFVRHTLTLTLTHIKTEWNWETCQHFRLGFYVCLSFLVISTHLNDNNNNNKNTRVPLLPKMRDQVRNSFLLNCLHSPGHGKGL